MINEHICLISQQLVLVPYLAPFVPRYHEWMCDAELLAATESEPLSLNEERENQLSWLHSTDKLTFILLAPLKGYWNGVSVEECQGLCGGDVEERQQKNDGTTAQLISLQGAVPPLSDVFTSAYSLPPGGPLTSFDSPAPQFLYPGSIVTTADHTCVADEFHASRERCGEIRKAYPLLNRYSPSQTKQLFNNVASSPTFQTQAACTEAEDAQRHVLDQSYVMIGDCNLFLLGENDDEEHSAFDWSNASNQQQQRQHRQQSPELAVMPSNEEVSSSSSFISSSLPSLTFEVEVMIADASFRRRGLAETAVRMMMQYAIAVCGATRFVAKILDTNVSSIALFTERLHFVKFKEVKVFHEIHFVRSFRTDKERFEWELECRRSGCGRTISCDASLQSRGLGVERHAGTEQGGSGGVEQPGGPSRTSTPCLPVVERGKSDTYWCASLDDALTSSIRIFRRVT